jgi:choline dehydrogenase-like flavoprotein
MHEKDWHKADMSVHGTSGPLHIEPHDLAPISERVKESMIDVGLSYHPDMFSTGETPHGCGDVPRTVHQGVRTTAADFVTKGYKRANITIKTEVVVDKILFSNDSGEPTATGVATISKTGKKTEYQAKNEIIVTAGAYCSPAILMRSGLGPAEELKKHGIECRVDLPGVGKNLQDHCVRDITAITKSCARILTGVEARVRLLRSIRTKPHQRLPRLPRQRNRINIPTLPRKEDRYSQHIPLR